MNTKDENLLVKVVKRAVGLPTGKSSCGCSAPAPVATECCEPEATEKTSSECGCDSSSAPEQERAAEA